MDTRPRLAAIGVTRKPHGSFRVVALALLIGAVTGAAVAAVHFFVVSAQRLMLGFAAERRIALPESALAWRIAVSLAAGAVLVTLVGRIVGRLGAHDPIDAVEANALRGGCMTWGDGAAVVLPILVSVGCGASVGIEAAVTQIGATVASLVGRRIGLKRSNLRILVAAGAAAAIAAAYRAPLAGMLYSYELVLGSYSKRTLAPVGLAAITAVVSVWAIEDVAKPFDLAVATSISWSDYPLAALIGPIAALTGIVLMLLVSSIERLLKAYVPDETARRLVGSSILLLLSLRFPSVLGSGHAAIDRAVNGEISGAEAAGLFGAKSIASAASLGSGFRGGLFSASLLIGALLGQTFAWALAQTPFVSLVNSPLFAMVGMASVAASVIGSPLAMIFLVLETTGDFDATVVVAIGAVTAAFLTDRLFGYSFATWRFQQRGLAIEGGHDVARLEATPIRETIKPPKRTLPPDAMLNEAIRAVSVAGAKGTAVLGSDGVFIGLIDPALVEAVADTPDLPVVAADLVYATNPAVTPKTNLAELIDIFRTSDRPTVAVLDPQDTRKLLGCIRARDAFDLASSALDSQRREELGVSS